MTDQHDFAAAAEMDLGLAMHLGDQRTGGVDGDEVARLGAVGHRFRHAMGGEHHRRIGVGNLVEFLDEDRALGLQAVDHVAVMHDLVPDIDRRAVQRERPLDRIDGAHHAGAEAARRAQDDPKRRLFAVGHARRARHWRIFHRNSCPRHGVGSPGKSRRCIRLNALGKAIVVLWSAGTDRGWGMITIHVKFLTAAALAAALGGCVSTGSSYHVENATGQPIPHHALADDVFLDGTGPTARRLANAPSTSVVERRYAEPLPPGCTDPRRRAYAPDRDRARRQLSPAPPAPGIRRKTTPTSPSPINGGRRSGARTPGSSR